MLEGHVNEEVQTSEVFTLDVSAPTLSSVTVGGDPNNWVVGGTGRILVNLDVNDVDDYSRYEYCFGTGLYLLSALFSMWTDPRAISLPLDFASLKAGRNDITFRVSDWLDNRSLARTQPFVLRVCPLGVGSNGRQPWNESPFCQWKSGERMS